MKLIGEILCNVENCALRLLRGKRGVEAAIVNTVGRRVLAARERLGWTQIELGKKSGVAHSITRLAVLKAAAEFAASRPEAKSSDVLKIADLWYAWAVQEEAE